MAQPGQPRTGGSDKGLLAELPERKHEIRWQPLVAWQQQEKQAILDFLRSL